MESPTQITPKDLTFQLVNRRQDGREEGREVGRLTVREFPFAIGRAVHCHLVLEQAYVSRIHAEIIRNGSELVLRDKGSKHGTFVNGERIDERVLRAEDVLQFGSLSGPELRQTHRPDSTGPSHALLTLRSGRSDIEKLRWFLEAAQDLNSANEVERVLASLLETTLSLAGMERGSSSCAARAVRSTSRLASMRTASCSRMAQPCRQACCGRRLRAPTSMF